MQAAGELKVSVTKVHLVAVHGCTRTLDLLVLTDQLAHEPLVTDVTPLYVKVRMLPGKDHPW